MQGGECVRERRLLEGSGTTASFPSLPHPRSAERTLKAAVGEMKSQGASTAGGEPVEGDGTPPTLLGRADAGTGGVSRGPPPGLASVQGSSSLGVQVLLAIYSLRTGGTRSVFLSVKL